MREPHDLVVVGADQADLAMSRELARIVARALGELLSRHPELERVGQDASIVAAKNAEGRAG